MSEVPETCFAETKLGRIAYQVVGDGPIDLIAFHPPDFPIDLMWDEPRLVRFLDRLSSFSRHIWFDPRGRGASDPLAHIEDRIGEWGADDMLALVDHLGCEQVVVLGLAAFPSILFAAAHPERTKALVLYNTSARYRAADDYPEGGTVDQIDGWFVLQRQQWGTGARLDVVAPSAADDVRLRRWYARCERLVCTADEQSWRSRASFETDLRVVLPSVQVPTLVLYPKGSALAPQARYVATRVPQAKLVELPAKDYLFFVGDTGPMLDAIEEFVTGQLPVHHIDRVLATVLFTDIVGSTKQAAHLGDRRWKEVLGDHDRLVGAEVERFRGRMVNTTGDGILATFDGPGRAIRCATVISESVRPLGIAIRAGLHTGEIELLGDDIGGIAVHIGQRISGLAAPGEVLVSRTVTDLVAGSGLTFTDRGEHELRGVPGTWRLFAVSG
jgi:class 3 adenylate cyclase/pimeloyl-ACP methyl ester carboxylesterase